MEISEYGMYFLLENCVDKWVFFDTIKVVWCETTETLSKYIVVIEEDGPCP